MQPFLEVTEGELDDGVSGRSVSWRAAAGLPRAGAAAALAWSLASSCPPRRRRVRDHRPWEHGRVFGGPHSVAAASPGRARNEERPRTRKTGTRRGPPDGISGAAALYSSRDKPRTGILDLATKRERSGERTLMRAAARVVEISFAESRGKMTTTEVPSMHWTLGALTLCLLGGPEEVERTLRSYDISFLTQEVPPVAE